MARSRGLKPVAATIVAVVLGRATSGIATEPSPGAAIEGHPPSAAARSPLVATDDRIVVPPPSGRSAEAEQAAELKLRYAAARVRLAELELERAVAANEAVRGAVGARELERLRNHVGLTRRQLEIVRAAPRTAARQATVAEAEAAITEARGDLAAALEANRRVPGSVSGLNVQRLQTRLEMAEIRVALCRNPASELSLLDEMQWTIDQLTDEVIDLRHRVETQGAGDFGGKRD